MKKIILAFALLMGLIGMIGAQAVKLGYVDTDRLLLESNEAAEISRLFNLDKANWTSQIKQLDEEIKQMERDFEIDKLTKTEAAKRDAQARIDAKKAEAGRLLDEYFGEGGQAEQRYRELIDPLTLKIHNIIKKTAEDEKYTMIFDVSMGTILYAAPAIDLTDQILLELNKDTIKPTDATEPPKDEIQPKIEDPFKPDGFGDEFKPDFKP
jgi:outer membrane protein